MTEEKFGELCADLWRAKQRLAAVKEKRKVNASEDIWEEWSAAFDEHSRLMTALLGAL